MTLPSLDWRVVATAFATLFLAEMGDKTQLAAFTMSGSTGKPVSVFVGAAAALVVVTAIGVVAGGFVTRYVPELWIRRAAGTAFVVLGVVTLIRAR
jgi:Ca2+/H+ antiporter, TMEM165/GDT1 family